MGFLSKLISSLACKSGFVVMNESYVFWFVFSKNTTNDPGEHYVVRVRRSDLFDRQSEDIVDIFRAFPNENQIADISTIQLLKDGRFMGIKSKGERTELCQISRNCQCFKGTGIIKKRHEITLYCGFEEVMRADGLAGPTFYNRKSIVPQRLEFPQSTLAGRGIIRI